MAKIKAKRGIEANIGNITLDDGEFAVTTDTKKLYVGIAGAKICLGGASSLGDMLKSIYDTDNDGIVDNAEALGGEPPSYYLNYNNFSNKPTIPTKTSQLTNDSNYIAKSCTWNQLKGV